MNMGFKRGTGMPCEIFDLLGGLLKGSTSSCLENRSMIASTLFWKVRFPDGPITSGRRSDLSPSSSSSTVISTNGFVSNLRRFVFLVVRCQQIEPRDRVEGFAMTLQGAGEVVVENVTPWTSIACWTRTEGVAVWSTPGSDCTKISSMRDFHSS